MRTRYWLLVLLCFAVFISGLSGCSSSKQKDNKNNTSTPNSQSSQQPRPIVQQNNTASPKKELPPPSDHHSELKPFLPTKLVIPTIKVSAKIFPVGVLADGQMDIPKSTEVVGILHPGVLAGAKGNMVMDGHVDSYTGPAIFYRLKYLKPGDAMIVYDDKKQQLTYRVQSVETFLTSEAPIDRIFGDTENVQLNLITCTGRYSRKKKEHEKRLVIFAKLEEK
ncbi:Sortase family protein [compost metagenome]